MPIPMSNNEQTGPQVAKLEQIQLFEPIGFGADMLTHVTPKPPKAKDLTKYKVDMDSETYENMHNMAKAMLPDVADQYKEELNIIDIKNICDKLQFFLTKEQ